MAEMRTRRCVVCKGEFSYEIKRGTDRTHCSDSCRAVSRRKYHEARIAAAPSCTTPGCDKKAAPYRGKDGLCEACYCYAWRTGRARDPKKKPYILRTVRRSTQSNYRVLRVPGHPLANGAGDVYHHRLIAYSTRAGVCGPCYWCAVPLQWKGAVVDHLNEDKADNTPSNLVISCNRCNRLRGAMLPFFRSLTPERFTELISLMGVQVQRTGQFKLAI